MGEVAGFVGVPQRRLGGLRAGGQDRVRLGRQRRPGGCQRRCGDALTMVCIGPEFGGGGDTLGYIGCEVERVAGEVGKEISGMKGDADEFFSGGLLTGDCFPKSIRLLSGELANNA